MIAAAAPTTADPEVTGFTQVQEIRALNFSLALTVLFAGGAVVIALEGTDVARQAVAEEMMLLHPDVDVAVLFRSVPAKSPSVTPPRPPAATV